MLKEYASKCQGANLSYVSKTSHVIWNGNGTNDNGPGWKNGGGRNEKAKTLMGTFSNFNYMFIL